MARAFRQGDHFVGQHLYDCRIPFQGYAVASAARQAIEELNPNMTPSDVAVARRVIGKMLDRLEHLEQTTVTVIDRPPTPPLLLTAAKKEDRPRERKRPFRPEVVATPREITHARTQHEQWLAQRKEQSA